MDASSSIPRKSPRLIELAESQKLEHAGDKRKRQEDASSSIPRKSPRLIKLAEFQKMEHARDKRKRQEEERHACEIIRNSFESDNERAARLEKRRIREKEKRAALTEEEKEKIRERNRIAYQKRKQRAAGGEIDNINQQRSTTGHGTSTTFTSFLDTMEKPGPISANEHISAPHAYHRNQRQETAALEIQDTTLEAGTSSGRNPSGGSQSQGKGLGVRFGVSNYQEAGSSGKLKQVDVRKF